MSENVIDRENQEQGNEVRKSVTEEPKGKNSKRGFASMDPEQQRQIAREGGRAAHKQGVAHEFNSEEARKAGRKGGEAVSANREHMSQIGRKGGEASRGSRGNNKEQQ